ncbi:MAG: hypothetical protein B7Y39_13265 [Bdellovibrio sp. 28-41-41]|nr:MAG: hypothetical protein B7Y39_13265 [Bdellovibrio sp. 28-41-41]
MATTIMGQTTPDVTPREYDKGFYWAIAAALAVLLIFAFSTNKTESVVKSERVNAPVTTPVDRTSAAMQTAPAMDYAPTNSRMSSPDSTVLSPQSDTINNEGVIVDPRFKMIPSPTGIQEPGTSVSPEAPKGTVVR